MVEREEKEIVRKSCLVSSWIRSQTQIHIIDIIRNRRGETETYQRSTYASLLFNLPIARSSMNDVNALRSTS